MYATTTSTTTAAIRIQNLIKERYVEIKEGGKAIHNVVKETNKVLRVSNNSPEWRAYLEFVNSIVVDGLAQMVMTSMDYLLDQLDPVAIARDDKLPMIEVKLDLVSVRLGDGRRQDEIKFIPELQESGGKGLRDLTSHWIGSFFNATIQMKRLDNEGTYMREIHANEGVMMTLAALNETLEINEENCMKIKEVYDKHSYLWLTDLDAYFAKFSAEAITVTATGQRLMDLAKYSEAIAKYEDERDAINALPAVVDVGWLRIHTAPAKNQMSSWISKWIDMFTSHIKANLITKLEQLEHFIQKVSPHLEPPIAATESSEPTETDDQLIHDVSTTSLAENSTAGEADLATKDNHELMFAMEHIRDVRKMIDSTAEMFTPLQESINLLKAHGKDVSSLGKVGDKLVQDYLDEAPMAWEILVKKAFVKKEAILPDQQKEMEVLKVKLEEFFISIREFRNNFRNNAPFTFTGSPKEAYLMLDTHALALIDKEAESKRINELEELFELQVSKYPEIGDTKSEIRLLKCVWDMKALVLANFESWNTQLWSDIKTDDLEDISKNLLKQLRKISSDNPVIKGWVVYRSIEDMIKNMNIVLPIINALHSPSMRDRHWKALAKVCHVKAIDPHDPRFTFEDGVKLNVHQHVDDVEDIIETANKELKIEKKLHDIEHLWRDMVMDYAPHNDSEMFLIKPSEEVIENLESHQLELQTMIGMGKFVDFFRDRVLSWQSKLGLTEDVIKVWVNVSRSWAALESIFLASADIRSQLPEDTKRFEGLDSEFKELMKDAVNEPNVISVTSIDGRQESLVSMMTRLDLCQKSLNEYLDQKKKIFPRFYFVSNVALLDMLANGTNPPRKYIYIYIYCRLYLAYTTYIHTRTNTHILTYTHIHVCILYVLAYTHMYLLILYYTPI